MANHCYNNAHIEGTEQMIDLFIQRLVDAKKEDRALFNPTFYQALGEEMAEEDVYNMFGSRWFDACYERCSPTSMSLYGDSAWSPINDFLLRLSSVYGFTIESTYEEIGDDFGGWFECSNGEITRDEVTSYHAFRYLDEGYEFFEHMLEDASEGYWADESEICEDLMNVISEEHKAELVKAIQGR